MSSSLTASTLEISPLQKIEARLEPLRARLTSHPLYSRIETQTDLRIFMESHVFAVWDFMSLLKALQSRLTCVTTPWLPTRYPESRRFINEIVLGEESDLYDGRSISHFELYLEAMEECGANTAPIRTLLAAVKTQGEAFSLQSPSLRTMGAPAAAKRFVESTFDTIQTDKPHTLAAAFTFGREDVIPDIFRELVRDLDAQLSGGLEKFVWYLERHIEVDGDEHGPLALKMIADLCGDDETLWDEAASAAESAIQARLALWDGILEHFSYCHAPTG
jgi:hypothetical protein